MEAAFNALTQVHSCNSCLFSKDHMTYSIPLTTETMNCIKKGCVFIVVSKMAAKNKQFNLPNGYQYEFLDTVNDVFYCKKCDLVARRLTATSCCGESYCHACIADICEQHKPCPECGQEGFSIYEQLKYQKRIGALRVHCSLKTRGCGWSGQLVQLDHHLDSEQGDCQYVDVKCPLNCQLVVPKNRVEQHLSEACTKRPYVCLHCAFKATYEDVVDKHLPECNYVPLPCPNRCGVTCDREDMEDHMKMCRLEEMVCKFSTIGCDGSYAREDEDEYTEKNTQKHLMLIAADAMMTKQQLQKKLQEQEQKLGEKEQKLGEQEQKLREQEQKLREQEQKLREHEDEEKLKLGDQEQKLEEQEQKLGEQEWKLGEQEQKLRKQEEMLVEQLEIQKQTIHCLELKFEEQIKNHVLLQQDLNRKGRLLDQLGEQFITSTRRFEMRNFSEEKAKDRPGVWKSPPTYTHLHGYKFCIGVDANGEENIHGYGITVCLYAMPGEFDEDLKWPVIGVVTVGLENQQDGRNVEICEGVQWTKPNTKYQKLTIFYGSNCYALFIAHSDLSPYLVNNTLHFYIKNVKFKA